MQGSAYRDIRKAERELSKRLQLERRKRMRRTSTTGPMAPPASPPRGKRLPARQTKEDLQRLDEMLERRRAYQREPMVNRAHMYGVDEAMLWGFWFGCGGRCTLCRVELAIGKDEARERAVAFAVLDHDHFTGRIRGFLCPSCNTFLRVYENGFDANMIASYLSPLGSSATARGNNPRKFNELHRCQAY